VIPGVWNLEMTWIPPGRHGIDLEHTWNMPGRT